MTLKPEPAAVGSSTTGASPPQIGDTPDMSKAVQFDSYGGIDVLEVRDVPKPTAGAGEVLVEVKAVGINPGEAMFLVASDFWTIVRVGAQGRMQRLCLLLGLVAALCRLRRWSRIRQGSYRTETS